MSDDFDDLIRSQMRSGVDSTDRSRATLEELKPAMRRARRRHRVAVGAMTAGTVVLAGVGVVALERTVRSPDTVQTVPADGTLVGVDEGEGEFEGSGPTTVTVDVDASGVDRTIVDGTIPVIEGEPGLRVPLVTSPSDSPAATTDVEPLPTVPTTPPQGTTRTSDSPASTSPPPVSPPPTTSPSPTTTVPPPTSTTTAATTTTVAATTTTVAQSGERVIASSCGTVTVAYDVTTVTLEATQPGPGFAVDVKNSGPEEVEVGFAGGDVECQIKAEMEAGQLVIDVEDPGG